LQWLLFINVCFGIIIILQMEHSDDEVDEDDYYGDDFDDDQGPGDDMD